MFVCYQDEKPCYVVDTLDAVDAIPSVTFTRVEEVPFAVAFNDKIYFSEEELYAAQVSAMETIRASLYNTQVDPLMSEYNRKKTFNLFEEGEEIALLAKIEATVAKIKDENPYPPPLHPEPDSEEEIAEFLEQEVPVVEEPDIDSILAK